VVNKICRCGADAAHIGRELFQGCCAQG
jgi:hypothetical protein